MEEAVGEIIEGGETEKKLNIEKNIVIMLGIQKQETKLKRNFKRGG